MVNHETHVYIESIVYFHVDTNEAEVISIQPVEQPIGEEAGEGVETGEGGIETGEGGIETGEGEEAGVTVAPTKPTTIVPQVLIPEVIKTNPQLETVVISIQQSTTIYTNVVPLSVVIEVIDSTYQKYVTVMEVSGIRQQIVTLYNVITKDAKTLSTKEIKTTVVQTYTKQTVTQTGDIVYSSNNVTSLILQFNDLKLVLN